MAASERLEPVHLGSRAGSAWTTLSTGPVAERATFDLSTLTALPVPAQRFLGQALPDGVALSSTVELAMRGEIKLGGRWLRFTARQILKAGVGFVWSPVVGGRLVRFAGADLLTPDDASMEFRFHRLIPVVRATGADVRRSAQGRLAAETVAWLPQALTPQMGARWTPVNDERAIVTLAAAGADIDVDVAVDHDGQIRRLGLQRWKDSARPPCLEPFGGSVDTIYAAANGVHIAGSGTVGWDFRTATEPDGVFFRYRITNAVFGRHEQNETP